MDEPKIPTSACATELVNDADKFEHARRAGSLRRAHEQVGNPVLVTGDEMTRWSGAAAGGAVSVEEMVTLCHEQDEIIKQQLIAIEALQVENAALSGRIVAAEQNLAESDKTGRIVGERLISTITETIRKAWPEGE